MSNLDDQKNLELFAINIYLKHLNINAIICIRESPDFSFILEGKNIGVEITRQRIEAGQFKVRQIDQEWQKIAGWEFCNRDHKTNKSISVTFDFKLAIVPPKPQHRLFVAEAHTIIYSISDLTEKPIEIEVLPDHGALIYKYVKRVFVKQVENHFQWPSPWTEIGVGLTDDGLLSIIEAKKHLKKNDEFDELRLLIDGSGWRSENVGYLSYEFIEYCEKLKAHLLKSAFDEVAIICNHSVRQWRRTPQSDVLS